MHLQVLNDPEKRRVYDQVGEEGLKGGMPPGGAPGFGGGGGGGGMPAGFQFRHAEDIFAEVITQAMLCEFLRDECHTVECIYTS